MSGLYRANPDEVRKDVTIHRNATALSTDRDVNPAGKQAAAKAAGAARSRLGTALGNRVLEALFTATALYRSEQTSEIEAIVRVACLLAEPDPGFDLADSVRGSLFDLMIRGEEEWSERRTAASFAALKRVEAFASGYCRALVAHGEQLSPVEALRATVRSYERFYGTHLPLCVPLP